MSLHSFPFSVTFVSRSRVFGIHFFDLFTTMTCPTCKFAFSTNAATSTVNRAFNPATTTTSTITMAVTTSVTGQESMVPLKGILRQPTTTTQPSTFSPLSTISSNHSTPLKQRQLCKSTLTKLQSKHVHFALPSSQETECCAGHTTDDESCIRLYIATRCERLIQKVQKQRLSPSIFSILPLLNINHRNQYHDVCERWPFCKGKPKCHVRKSWCVLISVVARELDIHVHVIDRYRGQLALQSVILALQNRIPSTS